MYPDTDNTEINADDLPQSEVLKTKEIYQHPQPADSGLPLKPHEKSEEKPLITGSRENEKTSKEEGLNETTSDGNAGAFEGFENQQE